MKNFEEFCNEVFDLRHDYKLLNRTDFYKIIQDNDKEGSKYTQKEYYDLINNLWGPFIKGYIFKDYLIFLGQFKNHNNKNEVHFWNLKTGENIAHEKSGKTFNDIFTAIYSIVFNEFFGKTYADSIYITIPPVDSGKDRKDFYFNVIKKIIDDKKLGFKYKMQDNVIKIYRPINEAKNLFPWSNDEEF